MSGKQALTVKTATWYVGDMMHTPWYILSVKPTKDREVEMRLLDSNILAISFFSERTVRHHRTKKELKKTAPLFPSYIFVQCHPNDWAEIKGMDGAVRFLSAANYLDEDKTPMAIDPAIVYTLLTKERAGAFRVGKNQTVVDLGDIVTCEVLGQMVEASVVKSGGDGAVLETFLNGMRIVFNKDASELRAA